MHSLRTSICVWKYFCMLYATFHDWGGGADDPDLSVALTRSMATLSSPDFLYIIHGNGYSLRLLVIAVFCFGLAVTVSNKQNCFL